MPRTIIALPSPNHDSRAIGTVVDMLVLHYTGMPTAQAALDRLCDPQAQVSAHYVVDEDGTVYGLVDEAQRAWHAGVAAWRGKTDINNRSIGIEMVNPGHEFGYRRFPPAQIASVIAVAHTILTRHPTIGAGNIVGHSDVAPWRKEDPGELFPWATLAKAGIGLFPASGLIAATPPHPDPEEGLRSLGYRIDGEATLGHGVTAFQRRYRPQRLSGEADRETCQILTILCRLSKSG